MSSYAKLQLETVQRKQAMFNAGFLNTWEGKAPVYKQWMQTAFAAFDIIGLSEVNSHPKDTPNDRVSFPNQFETVQRCYKQSHRGHFATSASSAQGIDYGLALFHRYDRAVFNVHSDIIHGQAGAFWVHPRIITSANQIQSAWYHTGTEWILFAHVHSLWRASGKHDCVERDAQSVRILHHLERRLYDVNTQGKAISIVLGGDFNMVRRLRCLQAIISSKLFGKQGGVVLNDALENGYDTRTQLYPENKETRHADFVIVSGSLAERATMTIDQTAKSDHALLCVAIET